jgi:hypothetical protein
MINTERIVPIDRCDLITMYGLIIKQGTATLAKVDAADADGNFEITAASTPLIASEPVATCDFAEAVTSATLYFVPAYDFVGFSLAGTMVTPTGDVEADGRTLYKAELATGAVTITKIGF